MEATVLNARAGDDYITINRDDVTDNPRGTSFAQIVSVNGTRVRG